MNRLTRGQSALIGFAYLATLGLAAWLGWLAALVSLTVTR